jgi:uncharacterized membrane protein (DUF106 family)
LIAENHELKQQNEFLEKQLLQLQTALQVMQSENTFYTETSTQIDFRWIKKRIEDLANQTLGGPIGKLSVIERRLDALARKVEVTLGQLSDESELRWTISELEEEIHELQANDATPKLMKLQFLVAELREDNRRLQSMTG